MITSRRVLIVIGILTLGTIMVVVGVRTKIVIRNKPLLKAIDHKCDPGGMKQADLVRFDINDSTTSFLRVLVNSGCDENEHTDLEKSIFVVIGNLKDDDVQIAWTAPDTLSIAYASGLKIIQQRENVVLDDTNLKVHVVYKNSLHD